MAYRDDLEAAHARIGALERELVAAKREERLPLRCENCKAAFDSVDLADGKLTCRDCRHVVPAGQPPPLRRGAPRGLKVDEGSDRLRIEWDWELSVGTMFGFAASAFLVIGALIKGGEWPAVIVVAVIVVGLIGLFAAYQILGQLLNRTIVEVTSQRLVVTTSPISLGGPTTLAAIDIDQIYCVIHHAKHSVWYSLEAKLRTGRTRRLVDEVADAERAFYLESQLEHRLGIIDRPVDGEVPRRNEAPVGS